MKTENIFKFASAGIIITMISVFFYNKHIKAQEPISVSYNPYESGVYATGIVETFQKNGSNINKFPSVAGRIIEVKVSDGSSVKKGDPLVLLDPSTQIGLLNQAQAQVEAAKAEFASQQDQYSKLQKSYALNPKSVSLNALDNAKNAVIAAAENLKATQAYADYQASQLEEYTIKADVDGHILRVVGSVGDYVTPTTGVYDPYTQGYLPLIQMGEHSDFLQVRVYVDELLIPMLPRDGQMEASLFVRGLYNHAIPLSFVSIQPMTIPNIQLSDQRNERVDVRVLPIIFKFDKPKDINIFPGQLVDIYIKAKS